jgi:hypothetical protein
MFYSQKNMSTAKMLPEYIDSIYVLANYEYRCLKNGAHSLEWLTYLKSWIKFRCDFFFLGLVSKLYTV